MPPLPPIVTLDDIPRSLPYTPDAKIFKPTAHIGQRKLFLTELQFLTDELRPEHQTRDSNPIVVYAGAAPSNHTGYLASLFPHVKFLLVDPNPFDIYEADPVVLFDRKDTWDESKVPQYIKTANDGTSNIYIINYIFTQSIADAIAKIMPRTYFISDIRTNANEGRAMPDAIDILWNDAQQYNWMKSMLPIRSMLKFRHPFYADKPEVFEKLSKQSPRKEEFALAKKNGIDFIANYAKRKLVYWAGHVNLQAWPGKSSTETRLITSADELFDYGTPETYDDKFYYYNSIDRCYGLHENDNADRKLGFDYCNDCALENLLWKNYLAVYPDERSVKDLVRKLTKITRRHLRREDHLGLWRKYTYGDIAKIYHE